MNKRLCCFVFMIILIIALSGCSGIQIEGLENFHEEQCSFGLTDDLLPGNREFLSQFSYIKGQYLYWRNDWGPIEANVFIRLQYSKEVYQQAKTVCCEYFDFSEYPYYCEKFTLFPVNINGGEISTSTLYPGLRMFGFDDESCMLIFVAYLDERNDEGAPLSNVLDFVRSQLNEGHEGQGDGSTS